MAILNNELDSVIAARDNIKTAINNKGKAVGNDIRTYSEAILNIEGGIDTSDATATSEDIKRGKTAYVNGQKIIGLLDPGTGDVKSFETVEEMQSSTGNQEGDLAVVYRNSIGNLTEDSEFQIGTFPETVILPEAITDYVQVGLQAVDSSIMFDCWRKFR